MGSRWCLISLAGKQAVTRGPFGGGMKAVSMPSGSRVSPFLLPMAEGRGRGRKLCMVMGERCCEWSRLHQPRLPPINSNEPPPSVTMLFWAARAHRDGINLFHPEPRGWPNWAANTPLQASVQDLLGTGDPRKLRSEDEVLQPNGLSCSSFDSSLSLAEGNGAAPDGTGLNNLEAGPRLTEPALSAIAWDKPLRPPSEHWYSAVKGLLFAMLISPLSSKNFLKL